MKLDKKALLQSVLIIIALWIVIVLLVSFPKVVYIIVLNLLAAVLLYAKFIEKDKKNN